MTTTAARSPSRRRVCLFLFAIITVEQHLLRGSEAVRPLMHLPGRPARGRPHPASRSAARRLYATAGQHGNANFTSRQQLPGAPNITAGAGAPPIGHDTESRKENHTDGSETTSPLPPMKENRPKVKAVAGVFTGVGRKYFDRRQAVRQTWMPDSEDGIAKLMEETGVVARFVMGFSSDDEEEKVLQKEAQIYGGMIRLNVREKYHNLVLKMRRYMQKAEQLYEFNYILKVDDDVYHNPYRLSWVSEDWTKKGADYVGCFLKNNGVTSNTNNKWFEPNAALIGRQFYTYPAGPTYAVSREAARRVSSVPDGWLRFFGCGDDCSVASWMMALNVTYHDDRRLCAAECHDSAVTVRHGPGLVNPIGELPELHSDPLCRGRLRPAGEQQQRAQANRTTEDPDGVDFTGTNCYQLPSPNDTSFDNCLTARA